MTKKKAVFYTVYSEYILYIFKYMYIPPVEVHSKAEFVLNNVQNMQFFTDTFTMVFTFNISSLLHSCRIKPQQRKAHNFSEYSLCP